MRQLTRYLRGNWKWLTGIFVSVVITYFSFPPHGLGLLMFVALAPVFMAMETAANWKQAAFRTWLYVFLGNAAICSWVAYSVHEFANLPWVLSYPVVLALSVVEQGSWPVLAALRHVVHRKLRIKPLLWTPAALLFLDVCWPKFFPNTMGNVFYRIPWLSQFADITGVWGLTALIAMTNELLAMLALKSWPRRDLMKHGLVSLAVLVAAFAYGHWRLGQVRELMKRPESSLKVAIVQPNVNGVMKVKAEQNKGMARYEVFTHMSRLSNRGVALDPDLLFWPETAFPDTYHGESKQETVKVTEGLDAYVKANQINLLFGARDQKGDRRYNALFYVNPDQQGGLRRQVYHKTILLELAERIPLAEHVPGLVPLLKKHGASMYSPGAGPVLFDGPRGIRLGPMICLEGLYPRFVREIAGLGADVLVSATNDGWFGPGMEPELHLYLTAFRSIETRRPLIRTTNTGYSAVIDIDGSLRFKTDLFTDVVADDEVPLYPQIRSPYLVLGDSIIVLCGVYLMLPFLRIIAMRRSRRVQAN